LAHHGHAERLRDQQAGYRVVAAVDNEPEVIEALGRR
jgi:hypothetical protein